LLQACSNTTMLTRHRFHLPTLSLEHIIQSLEHIFSSLCACRPFCKPTFLLICTYLQCQFFRLFIVEQSSTIELYLPSTAPPPNLETIVT
jgi:hypothetical protein